MSTAERHAYGAGFFDYINAGSTASARRVVPLVAGWLAPASLLDVGCGAGAWCKVWREAVGSDVVGVDGAYVDTARLLVPAASFHAHDLATRLDLGRRFDLVTSLEVAEHVPGAHARGFVENLVRHGDRVLFSAAVPGQGGEFHVNEQPLSYWRAMFAEHGYRCFDPVRPRIAAEPSVEPWYRYNTLLYVADGAAADLPVAVKAAEIRRGEPIPDRSPLAWRARNAVLRQMPAPVLDGLVRLKHAWGRRMRPLAT